MEFYVCFCNLRCLVRYAIFHESASDLMKITTFSRIEYMTYTTTMKLFVSPTPPPRPKTETVRTISIALAGVFVLLAVAQLFTFEKFPAVIAAMWLPGDDALASVRAALIVTLEVAAVPFFLSMRLSPAMRVVSMVAGWCTIAAWLCASVWQNVSGNVIASSGLLGATIKLPVGWWSVLFCIGLAVLVGWTAWGMWPFAKSSRS